MENKKKKTINLASLYPRPKTYEELHARQEASRLRMISRQPKFVPFMTSLNLSFAALVLTAVIGDFWSFMFLGIITGVSMLFLLGIIWTGFVGWQFKRLSEFLGYHAINATPLIVAYCMSVIPLLHAVYVALYPVVPVVLVYACVMLASFLLVMLLVTIMTTQKLSNVYKLVMLITVVLLSIGFSVIETVI